MGGGVREVCLLPNASGKLINFHPRVLAYPTRIIVFLRICRVVVSP